MQTHLSNLEAVIPSPEGELLIKWELEAEEGRLSVTIPGDIKMKLNIAEMADYSINSIYVDEKSLDKKELNQGSLLLSRGSHEISF